MGIAAIFMTWKGGIFFFLINIKKIVVICIFEVHTKFKALWAGHCPFLGISSGKVGFLHQQARAQDGENSH